MKLHLWALACVAILGCQAASSPRVQPASGASRAYVPVVGGLPELVAYATRLDQATRRDRFDALLALLDDRGVAFELQPFVNSRTDEGPRLEGRNVVIDLGSGARDLIVGAHTDAVSLPDGSLGHGMVDNAASVAVLIRVAETLPRLALRHRVRVVLFDLEELGLVGSRHFVASLDRGRVAAMVNLDIAGRGDTVVFGPGAATGNTQPYAAVRWACAESTHACLEFPEFPVSDDRSFQAAGIPNVSLGTVPGREAHQLWLLLNAGDDGSGLADDFVPAILRLIHTPADRVELLEPAAMTLAYNMVMRVLLQLDRMEDP